MGVTPGIPAPDGAFVLGSAFGSDITEATGKASLNGDVLTTWGQAQEVAHDAYNDPIAALQNNLNLLEGVPAYGAAYMSYNIWVVNDNPILPFNAQIGPAKRVTVQNVGSTTDGRLRGTDYGLWQVNALVHGNSTAFTGNASIRMDICVDVHDAGGIILQYQQQVFGVANPKASIADSFMFVVPEDLTYFDVYIKASSTAWRQFLGGTKYTMLSLLRISEDVDNANPDSTVPDGNASP